MKHRLTLAFLICLSFPSISSAQSETTVADPEFRTRVSLGVDWKIRKGLHVEAGYEMRTMGNLSGIERHQLAAGIRYSPVSHLDIGCGYCYIGHYDSEKNFKPQHRVYVDVIGSYKFGEWKLSLRERVQLTHRSYGINEYQQTPNPVELKSRLKLAYKGFIHVEPYAFLELRNCFNGPSFNAEYNEVTGKYSKYEFLGYSDAYVNRVRASLGLEWTIDRRNSVDVKVLADFCREKCIDTNAKGTKLKSFTWEKSTNVILSVGYFFSF